MVSLYVLFILVFKIIESNILWLRAEEHTGSIILFVIFCNTQRSPNFHSTQQETYEPRNLTGRKKRSENKVLFSSHSKIVGIFSLTFISVLSFLFFLFFFSLLHHLHMHLIPLDWFLFNIFFCVCVFYTRRIKYNSLTRAFHSYYLILDDQLVGICIWFHHHYINFAEM